MKDPYEVEVIDIPHIPHAFIRKRLQSLTGVFLVIFLIEHLLTNSQSALLLGDNGMGFVRMVNSLHTIPYLHVVEIMLLAIPIALHAVWGIYSIHTSRLNSFPTNGTKPSLEKYSRNQAFTWQRISAIILIVGVLLHVVSMRFIKSPQELLNAHATEYYVKVSMDKDLCMLAERLDVRLYDKSGVDYLQKELQSEVKSIEEKHHVNSKHKHEGLKEARSNQVIDAEDKQDLELYTRWIAMCTSQKLKRGEVLAISGNIGAAMLLVVRDTFKSTTMCIVYTLFVIAAVYHACNGLWTFAITWGITLNERSRIYWRYAANSLGIVLLLFGLMSIWGTYLVQ